MPKTDKIEYERRIFTIQGWIVEGVQSSLIIQQVLAKEWCTSSRQAERMMAEARKRWIQHESDEVEERRLIKIQELKHMKRSLKDPYKGTPAGIRSQLAVEKEIIMLEGIRPKQTSKPVETGNEVTVKIVRVKRDHTGAERTAPSSAETEE